MIDTDEYWVWLPRDVVRQCKGDSEAIARWWFKFHSDSDPYTTESEAHANVRDALDYYGDDTPLVLFKMEMGYTDDNDYEDVDQINDNLTDR